MMPSYSDLLEWLRKMTAGKQLSQPLESVMPLGQQIGFLSKDEYVADGVKVEFLVFDEKNLIKGEVAFYKGDDENKSAANFEIWPFSSLVKKEFELSEYATRWGTDRYFKEQSFVLVFENGGKVSLSPSQFDQTDDEFKVVFQSLLQL